MLRFVFKPRWILGHLFVLAAAYTCLRLGGWQLDRAHLTASAQNWGYAFQWPLFAVCFLIGWWRMLRLESRRLDELAAGGDGAETGIENATAPPATSAAPRLTPAPRPVPAEAAPRPTPVDPDDDHDEDDEGLAAYNRMLAALAAQDEARDRR